MPRLFHPAHHGGVQPDAGAEGEVAVVRAAQADPKAPEWVTVRVEPVRPLPPVTLAAIKAEPSLAAMELIRQSRLSVAPVRAEEWAKVLELSQGG